MGNTGKGVYEYKKGSIFLRQEQTAIPLQGLGHCDIMFCFYDMTSATFSKNQLIAHCK